MIFILLMVGVILLNGRIIYKETRLLLSLGLSSQKIWPVILFTATNFLLAVTIFLSDHLRGTETFLKHFFFLAYLFGLVWMSAIQYVCFERASKENERKEE